MGIHPVQQPVLARPQGSIGERRGDRRSNKKKGGKIVRGQPVVFFDWTLLAPADPNAPLREQGVTANKGEELPADLH